MRNAVLCGTVLACLLPGAIEADDSSMFPEYKALFGPWMATEPEREYKGIAYRETGTIRFRGPTTAVYEWDGHKREFSVRIRPDEVPKQIDLVETRVGREEALFRGIYRIDDGRLTMCVGLPDVVRPTEFKNNWDKAMRIMGEFVRPTE